MRFQTIHRAQSYADSLGCTAILPYLIPNRQLTSPLGAFYQALPQILTNTRSLE